MACLRQRRVRRGTSPRGRRPPGSDGEFVVVRETTADYLSADSASQAVIAEAAGQLKPRGSDRQRLECRVSSVSATPPTDLAPWRVRNMELREGTWCTEAHAATTPHRPDVRDSDLGHDGGRSLLGD